MEKENKTGDPLINIWRENLQRCIKTENYEAACVWRDRIKERLKILLKNESDKIKDEGNE